ncbi:maltose permease [Cryptococcus neoformans var. grubii Br795]|uniref:Maltose permease n=2 Tax=Cryptococcus neoformans TaxID=5207 RepID=A0A854Q8A6_CRYNE|nr:maltose permease [Cryptococcus neoformans var. grubii H99]AUB26216.1 maltose permease [Cryptococcus neoformans var. grubii]OWT38395.1 maltose permease [Cryptococcus neoformans var. grubii Bt1]OWZ52940.1 maltose permease [Cryptococcus neoformans var. grubii 125.91]OXG17648.1 maltose permease [Cryptococcus neoformans var. grubii Tu259-1]OXG48196.1 maltose permease [Cryptococcus neoformans var. grubii Th84]OXG61305.1 maltose permease [Cryptococcus neoformans var. grubii c8]OXG79590.1 maltose|eukprot:XP_012050826.1 maltose permease [Cryptococcus neoformans var. grubii H99]
MTEEVAKAHDSYSEKVLDESGVVVQELGSNSFPVVVPAVGKWAAIKADRRAFAWSLYILFMMTSYGFDALLTGSVIGIPAFQKHFGYYDEASGSYIISALWQSLWTAITALAMLVGSLACGQIGDRFGLRITLITAIIFTIAGVLFEQLSRTPGHFLGAKTVAGFGYGLQTSVAMMTLSSFAPVSLRGPMGAGLNTFILFGGWLASGTITGTGTVYPDSTKAYQIPFALQYVFIGVVAAGVLFVPETASFYLKQDKDEEAKRALIKLHGSSRMDIVEQDLERAKLSRELDNRFSHAGLTVGPLEPFHKPHRTRTLICCAALGFGQLAGASFVTTYLTYFFQVAGAPDNTSLALGQMSFTLMVIGNLVSWYAIDKLGRRVCLVGGLAIMTTLLIIIGITWAVRTSASLWIMVALMSLWAFFYQGSIGACGYSIMSETPSARMRPATVALASATNQVTSWVMGFATPYMVNPDEANMGGYVGFVFAGLCAIACIWAFFCVPETAGRTSAEIDKMWADEIPVRKWKRYTTRVEHETA